MTGRITVNTAQLTRCERAFWEVAAVRPISDERTQQGDDAFWEQMCREFPAVQVGEEDPGLSYQLEQAQRRAVAEWDTEGLRPETNAGLRVLFERAANIWLYYGHPANQEVQS